jgi:hypothetical protein
MQQRSAATGPTSNDFEAPSLARRHAQSAVDDDPAPSSQRGAQVQPCRADPQLHASFYPRTDHHLGELDVRLQTRIESDGDVTITATFGLRDPSGNWDDFYGGRIEFAVIGC